MRVTAQSAPDQTNPKDLLGLKKPPLHLAPCVLWIWVSKVFGFSAKKYGPYNWRTKNVRLSVYLDAIGRHLCEMMDGQKTDHESGLPIVAHIAANCAIIMDAELNGNLIDDQEWPKGKAGELISTLIETGEQRNDTNS